MTEAEFAQGLEAGAGVAQDLKDKGFGILALGEIGIGNTSSAAAVAHAVTGERLDRLVGNGAGAPLKGLEHKRDVLGRAYARALVRDGRDALMRVRRLRVGHDGGRDARSRAPRPRSCSWTASS